MNKSKEKESDINTHINNDDNIKNDKKDEYASKITTKDNISNEQKKEEDVPLKKLEKYKTKYDLIYKKQEQKDMLFDLSKMKISLNFFDKNDNYDFYETIRQKLTSSLNTLTIPIENVPHYLYLTYNELDTLKPNILLYNETIIHLFISIDPKLKRDSYIQNYKNQVEKLKNSLLKNKKGPKKLRTKLIFICDKEENIPKEIKDSSEILYFLKDNYLISEISRIILSLLTDYINSIINKPLFNPSMRYSKENLGEIQERVGQYIQIQFYEYALDIVNRCIESFMFLECGKWKEIKAIIFFLSNYHHNDEFDEQYDPTILMDIIEQLYDDALKRYKKEKNQQHDLYAEGCLRYLTLICYYHNPYNSSKRKKCIEIINKCYNEINTLNPSKKYIYFLRLANLFGKLKMERKANLFMYFGLLSCYDNIELHKMAPFMMDQLCSLFNLYDIEQNNIKNYNDFTTIHNKIISKFEKPYNIYIKDTKNDNSNNNNNYTNDNSGELYLVKRKKYDQHTHIYVKSIISDIDKYIYYPYWTDIQMKMYLNVINYYSKNNKINNQLFNLIKYSLSYLQCLHEIISQKEQENILLSHRNNCLYFQNKIYLNLYKLPILMRIVPLSSEIKFDTSINQNKQKNDNQTKNVFLYNPWEKSKYENYYWTSNSYQNIKVQLYNPLNVELIVSKISILYEDNTLQFSYPSSIIISPLSSVYIICKVHLLKEGLTSIIGIQYEIVNTVARQYVDSNGNGLFYNFRNLTEDKLNLVNNNINLISLNNIKIFPEIPLLDMKIRDDINNKTSSSYSKLSDDCIDLFDCQYYTFTFNLENIGNYDINELIIYIYAYKKKDYKVNLDEIKIKTDINKGKSYIFNYKYLHKISHKKIEFRIYYISNEKNKLSQLNDNLLIKPYLYYSKDINTLNLFEFKSKKIIPIISSCDVNQLAKIDNRIKKNFNLCFTSDKKYIAFTIENSHESDIQLKIINTEKDKNNIKDNSNLIIIEDTIEKGKSKEIFFEIDLNCNFDKLIFYWNLIDLDNCGGNFYLYNIFNNFNYNYIFQMWSTFTLDMKAQKINSSYFIVNYLIKNNSKNAKNNLYVYLYLYQLYDSELCYDNYIFNADLGEDIFYDGTLSFKIDSILPGNTYNYKVKVYPLNGETIRTTFIVVDRENYINFMCPLSLDLDL